MDFYRDTIKPGKEGYLYLLKARGTNRYKIGRSKNPLARHQALKNQSPYPLEIISTFYTLDAITDEIRLHEHFGDFRVYGEWFEASLNPNDANFYEIFHDNFFSWTNSAFCLDAMKIFARFNVDVENDRLWLALHFFELSTLYRKKYQLFWDFTEQKIPSIFCMFTDGITKNPTEFTIAILLGAAQVLDMVDTETDF